MLMSHNGYSKDDYLDKSIEWQEISMTKALKLWANNDRHIRCVVDDIAYYYYHGQYMEFEIKSKDQITKGKWYMEKK